MFAIHGTVKMCMSPMFKRKSKEEFMFSIVSSFDICSLPNEYNGISFDDSSYPRELSCNGIDILATIGIAFRQLIS